MKLACGLCGITANEARPIVGLASREGWNAIVVCALCDSDAVAVRTPERERELNGAVTNAIWHAEHSDDKPEERREWRRVAEIEERIAAVIPADELEGQIARRGVVMSAINAGDERWAMDAYARWMTEPGDKSWLYPYENFLVSPCVSESVLKANLKRGES